MTDPSFPSPQVETVAAERRRPVSSQARRDRRHRACHPRSELLRLEPDRGARDPARRRAERVHAQLGAGAERRSPILVVPYQAARIARANISRSPPIVLSWPQTCCRRNASAACFIRRSMTPRSRCREPFPPGRVAIERTLLAQDSRLLWNESFVAVATTSLTGLQSDDRITINGAETPWQPCLEAVRSEQDCKGPPLVLASVPVAIRAQAVLPARPEPARHELLQRDACRQGARRDDPVAVADAELCGKRPSRELQRDAQGFEGHWQTSNFGSPPISTAGRSSIRPCGKARQSASSYRGHADLPHDHPRGEVRAAVHRTVVRDLFLLRAVRRACESTSCSTACSHSRFRCSRCCCSRSSEPIGYTAGYIVSAGLVLVQSSLYTAAVARRVVPALVFAGVQASLFAFIYVLLDLETYSLLIGALALFAVVSVLMVLTQRVNWSPQPLAFLR